MLSNVGSARNFMADVLSIASHLVHRFPLTTIGYQTPKKVWSHNVVNYFVLKIFGFSRYVQVNDGKLMEVQKKCIFLDYAQDKQSH